MSSKRFYAFRQASPPPSEEDFARLDERQSVDAILKWYDQNFEEAPAKEEKSDALSHFDFLDCEDVLEETFGDYVSPSTLSLAASYLNEIKTWVPSQGRMEAEEEEDFASDEETESVAQEFDPIDDIFEEHDDESSDEDDFPDEDEDIKADDSLDVALEKFHKKLADLESALSMIEENRQRRGHNNPPDEVQDAALSDSDRALLKECIQELRGATTLARVEREKVEGATSTITILANKFGGWIGRRTEEFSGAFAKRAGDRAADLFFYGIAATFLHSLITSVISAAYQVLQIATVP